jgi:hypothetical protein
MSQQIQLTLPDDIFRRAEEVAGFIGRDVQDVLIGWLQHSADDFWLQSLPDDQLLALADLHMNPQEQAELSDLLELNGEDELDPARRTRLDELMSIYERGTELKSEAYAVAVQRGLKPSLSR